MTQGHLHLHLILSRLNREGEDAPVNQGDEDDLCECAGEPRRNAGLGRDRGGGLHGRAGPGNAAFETAAGFRQGHPEDRDSPDQRIRSGRSVLGLELAEAGEHSGTHFDAPHHWITGKDYADGYTDTLPVQRLVAPVNVLDFSKECGANPDFLLTIDHVKAWEAKHGAINAGEWVVLRSDWDKRAMTRPVPERQRDRPAYARADRRGDRVSDRTRASSAGAASASAPMRGRPGA
jgi:hypothetical protein